MFHWNGWAAWLAGVGGIVAGLLLFAIVRLQRLGERIVKAGLPNVRDIAAYRGGRAKELYAAARAAAMQDGAVTEKERGVLATLRGRLGLMPPEALAIERDVA